MVIDLRGRFEQIRFTGGYILTSYAYLKVIDSLGPARWSGTRGGGQAARSTVRYGLRLRP